MEYFYVAVETVMFIAILSLVKMIVPKVLGDAKLDKSENGTTYFDQKGVSNAILCGAILFTIMVSLLFTQPSNVEGRTKTILTIIFVCFCLMWYVISLMFGLWYLCLDKDKIICRSCFGKKTIIKVEDIDDYERKPDGRVYIYSNSRAVANFESYYANSVLLWLGQKNAKKKRRTPEKYFIIRPARYQRVLSIICFSVFLAGMILGIVTKNDIVIVVFGVFLILGIWNLICHYTEKYVVGEGIIEKTIFLKKTIRIPYSEISRAENEDGDNVSYLLLYTRTQTKPLAKINTYYENAFRLKALAKQKKWLRDEYEFAVDRKTKKP